MTPGVGRIIQREFACLAQAYSRLGAARALREAGELIAWVRPGPHERALDVACGIGVLVRAMAQRVAEIHASDVSLRMVQLGRDLGLPLPREVLFSVSDAEALPYRSGSFDLVTCTYSFAVFRDPLRVLREFARVVRRGGRILLVDVMAPESPTRCAALNRLEAMRSHFHRRVLRRSEFLELFRRARLRPEACRFRLRRQAVRDWLLLSPAAADVRSARLLRQRLLGSIASDRQGLRPRQHPAQCVLERTTGWFLLRRR